MKDVQGVELEIGQKIAVARPSGSNACIEIGEITAIKEESGKIRYFNLNAGHQSAWISVKGHYNNANKVVVL